MTAASVHEKRNESLPERSDAAMARKAVQIKASTQTCPDPAAWLGSVSLGQYARAVRSDASRPRATRRTRSPHCAAAARNRRRPPPVRGPAPLRPGQRHRTRRPREKQPGISRRLDMVLPGSRKAIAILPSPPREKVPRSGG